MHKNQLERHTHLMSDLLCKQAEALPTNDKNVRGENPIGDDVPPADRGVGTIDAPRGERGPASQIQFSDAVREAAIAGRQKMLTELFGNKGSAETAARGSLKANLVHAASGRYEGNSALVEKRANDLTVSERLARLG